MAHSHSNIFPDMHAPSVSIMQRLQTEMKEEAKRNEKLGILPQASCFTTQAISQFKTMLANQMYRKRSVGGGFLPADQLEKA